MVSGCLAKVVFSDIKHNFLIHYLLATGFILITPIIFGISELNERMSAQPLEMMSSIIGIVTLTPVFLPEQNKSIRDLVRAKKTSHELVCIMRTLCSIFVIFLLVGLLAVYMKYNDSDVSVRLYFSAVSGAFALGGLGYFMAAVGDNVTVGYMISASYFLMNLFLRNRLDILDLFTFTDGGDQLNIWLYVISLILIIFSIVYRKITAFI